MRNPELEKTGPLTPHYDTAASIGNLAVMEEVADALATRHVVQPAPSFSEVAADESRDEQIVSIVSPVSTYGRVLEREEPAAVWSEHEAVNDLAGFLEVVQIYGLQQEEGHQFGTSLSERAADMQESLTFIGSRELTQAQAGIAQYWKDYLRSYDDHQLRVLTPVSEITSTTKSDRFMLDGILAHFSNEDIVELGDRIEWFIRASDKRDDSTKVVLLDDWMISGGQMRDALSTLGKIAQFAAFKDNLEINLVTAGRGRIEDGFRYTCDDGRHYDIPVKAYFESLTSELPSFDVNDPQYSYITGAHSSVDFSFEADHVEGMLLTMKDFQVDQPYTNMPGTTNIHRPYKVPGFKTQHIDRFVRVREAAKE